MNEKTYNVLFICTGNSARSIMAESVMNAIGQGRFKAYSAGSFPKEEVNPRTVQVLNSAHFPVDGLRSKSWNEFAQPGAPVMDFVFTVCDKAAGEACPVWPGQPMLAHWGVEDPVEATGTDEQIQNKFKNALIALKRRIELFAALPLASLDRLSIQHEIQQIGQA